MTDDNDEVTLRFRRTGLLVSAIGCAGLVMALFWVAYTVPRVPPDSSDDWLLAGSVIAGFTFLGGWSLLTLQAWARLTHIGIEARRASGRMDRVVWPQVVVARYAMLAHSLVFHGHDGERVYVPITNELEQTLPILRRHLRPEQYEEAVALGLRIRDARI